MPTYVKDAEGNVYERKYDKDKGTYVDYYKDSAANAYKYDTKSGNPDKDTGYKPGNYDTSSGTFYNPSGKSSSSKSSGSKKTDEDWAQELAGIGLTLDDLDPTYRAAVESGYGQDYMEYYLNLGKPQQQTYRQSVNPMDIYDQIMGAVKKPKLPPWEEYIDMATRHINPMFQDSLSKLTQATDAKNIASGFYGQLPGDVMKKELQGRLMNERDANIMNLAYQMQQGDKAAAEAGYNRDLSTYLQALDYATARNDKAYSDMMSFLQMQSDQDKFAWQQKKDIADYTGIWDGQHTLAFQKYLTDLGFKHDEAERATTKMQAEIAQGWARISETKRHNLELEGMNQQQFAASIMERAVRLAKERIVQKLGVGGGLTEFDLDALFANNAVDPEEFENEINRAIQDLLANEQIGDLMGGYQGIGQFYE